MFLRMYELTGSNDDGLKLRAVKAAEFLLRIQLPSGDFTGSVFSTASKGKAGAISVDQRILISDSRIFIS